MGERASSILEEVKALPASEREVFATLFDQWKVTSREQQTQAGASAWPDFAGRVKALFGERTIPGNPQEFWDEERGN